MSWIRNKLHKTLVCIVCTFLCFCVQGFSLDLLTESLKTGTVVYWDPLSGNGLLEKNGHQVSFSAGQNVVLLDNRKLALVDEPVIKDGNLSVTSDFLSTIENFFKQESADIPFRVGAIIVDPGHGGKDPGALQEYTFNGKKVVVREKDITLAVGKMLYSRLKSGYPDKQILMTRSTDVFLSLGQRTDIANSVSLKDHEAILFVSIHANASLDKKASGYETWYLTPDYRRTVLDKDNNEDNTLFPILNSMMEEEYTTESILIAKFIMDGLQAQLGGLSTPRGIKAEEWFVVRNANMPSVLIETGFVTNEKEAALLNDQGYLKKVALGIYNGLTAFVTHFERSRGFTGTQQ
ncbi:MAG: N-acetylmuramoyl-L-alanine amidase [Treponema sp.]|nr:N-acetylmuramoyl-L-alanine amidase [Treponema sp.]